MSRTKPCASHKSANQSSLGGEVSGEVSEVVERHGRGRDADSILQALEEVCERGGKASGWEREPSRGELQRALVEKLEACGEDACRRELLGEMERLAEDLRAGSLRPSVEWTPLEGRPSRLMIRFHAAFALERAIPEMLDIRGFFLECEHRPPMLEDIAILIGSGGVDPVKLEGKVVRSAANGIALQIYGIDERTERALRALPARMTRER